MPPPQEHFSYQVFRLAPKAAKDCSGQTGEQDGGIRRVDVGGVLVYDVLEFERE